MGHDDIFRLSLTVYKKACKIYCNCKPGILLRDRIQSALPDALDQQHQAYRYRRLDLRRSVSLGRYVELYRWRSNRDWSGTVTPAQGSLINVTPHFRKI